MATRDDIVQLYVGYFNRAPDPEGLNFWLGEIEDGSMTIAEIAESFSVQPEATELYPFLKFPQIVSPEAFVTQVYLNLFNREPDEAGLEFWTGEIADGKPIGEAIVDIMSGAVDDPEAGTFDATVLANKVEAANNWTTAVATDGITYFNFDEDGVPVAIPSVEAAAKEVISDVDETEESVEEANQKTEDFVNSVDGGTDPETGNIFFLNSSGSFNPITGEFTTRDNISGTTGDDTFFAEPGDLITGDRIDGGNGLDELIATLEAFSDEESPITTGVEHVVVTMQAQDSSNSGDNNIDSVDVIIDGGRMVGVTRWEDYDSRADLVIEDARDSTPEDGTFTADITVAMVSTDPGNVDYAIYFDDPVNISRNNDSIFIEIIDQNNSRSFSAADALNGDFDGSLTDAVLDGFAFTFNGERIDIDVPTPLSDPDLFEPDGDLPLSFGANVLYTDLVEVIQFAIDNSGTAAAGDIQVSVTNDVFSENIGDDNASAGSQQLVFGRRIELTSDSGAALGDAGANDFDAFFTQDPGDIAGSVTAEEAVEVDLIEVKIELDDVGKSSAGGDLIAGAMSTGTQSGDPRKSDSVGIQQFNIHVDRESNLQTINSTNNSLQEVYIDSYDNDTARGDSNDDAGRDDLQSGDLIVRGGTVPTFASLNSWPSDSTISDNDNQPFPGMAPQHDIFGFNDVRVIDATGLNGAVDLTLQLSDEIVEKYLDLQDTAQNQNLDNIEFDYDLSSNDDEFLVVLSNDALTAAGTGSREDFELDINGGGGDDWITVNVGEAFKVIDNQGQDWFGLSTGSSSGLPTDTASGLVGDFRDSDGDNVPDWYENQTNFGNATMDVRGGSGADTIWTYGYGDYFIDGGSGDDTIYADNSGINWLYGAANLPTIGVNSFIDRPVTEQDNAADNIRGDHYQIDYAVNAMWTFNDDNINGVISDIQGTTNDTFITAQSDVNLRDYVVTVSYNNSSNGGDANTYYQSTVELVIGANQVIDDSIMTQAIKEAILTDKVMSDVLEVQDGPGQSLLVWSKIDGDQEVTDLSVTLNELDANGFINSGFGTQDYNAFTGVDYQEFGRDSVALTQSDLLGGTGDDTIVMSSSKVEIAGTSLNALNPQYNANQTVTFGRDFGTDTVFHFDRDNTPANDGFGNDELRFSVQSSWDGVSQGLSVTDDIISIIVEDGTNDTAGEIADDYAGLGAGENALAIVYDDNTGTDLDNNNAGDVYYITGTATSATAEYLGTVNLIGVDWGTLNEDDFANIA